MKTTIQASLLCLLLTVTNQNIAFAEEAKKAERGEVREMMKKRMEDKLARVDSNQDGLIDREEYLKVANQRFDRMDANGDGVVTREEARQARKAMREKHRALMREQRGENK